MNTADLHPAAVSLAKGMIDRLHAQRGKRIEALSGCLWITQDHDQRDIVIGAGEGFEIDRDGDALVSALAESRYVVLERVAYPRAA